jgi:hypothetical protein
MKECNSDYTSCPALAESHGKYPIVKMPGNILKTHKLRGLLSLLSKPVCLFLKKQINRI